MLRALCSSMGLVSNAVVVVLLAMFGVCLFETIKFNRRQSHYSRLHWSIVAADGDLNEQL